MTDLCGHCTRQTQNIGYPLPQWPHSIEAESLLEVNETGDKVRRRDEVREPKGLLERSVYAKGFGDERPSLQL
ncbi:hypothetical protein JB92DRAFT_2923149 [Gautieria morchelliformis]|nr:hypothetical protein JB92DRAFT_2923149 [Gautieria morchelliformis]